MWRDTSILVCEDMCTRIELSKSHRYTLVDMAFNAP